MVRKRTGRAFSGTAGIELRFLRMSMRVLGILVCAALCIGASPHHSRPPPRQLLTAEAIEQAQFGQGQKANTALIVKAEVFARPGWLFAGRDRQPRR
jgi:hypothetical protein